MTVEELASALTARGSAVAVMGETLTVTPDPNRPYLDEAITLKNGQPHWSWNQPVDGETPDDVAEHIEFILSLGSTP